MGKNIAIFADGTGNTPARLSRTNVWRLYQALDTNDPPPPGADRQVSYYHDGVGTSSFKPLAFLGGAFGWGLKRNILDLYRFLCRNYEPGDKIYAFGFSRGAFTIRVLAGLVVREGLVADTGRQELGRYSLDAYRAYRRRFKQTGWLVEILRDLRDAVVKGWRKLLGQKTYAQRKSTNRSVEIAFIGVWDTVAAYGLPIDELTHGVDHWIWPLSMPNYELSPKVKTARHALALDDERNTFHPLLWDERRETDPERIRQVWFAGMHSDVGGGYPDDPLAYVPLQWMLDNARDAGLHFAAEPVAEIDRMASFAGPLHDSRRGFAGYYRYQPRKLSARIQPPDPTTLLMQNPETKPQARLVTAHIHESVLERIQLGRDRYAPIVLPEIYTVVPRRGSAGARREIDPATRAAKQERVWDRVWHKRWNYFLMVGISIYLAGLPLWSWLWPPSACVGAQCLLTPVIAVIGEFLPGFVNPWIAAFAAVPGRSAVTVFVLALLLLRSASLQRQIHDEMRALWEPAFALPATTTAPAAIGAWVRALRSCYPYQRGFQFLKWTLIPNFFGLFLLVIGPLLIVAALGFGAARYGIWAEESANTLCRQQPASAFTTDTLCMTVQMKAPVQAKKRYRVTMVVTEPWMDGTIDTSPEGFGATRMSFAGNLLASLRRSPSANWFQPLVKIVSQADGFAIEALDMQRMDASPSTYVGQFVAKKSGDAYLFVNDVHLPSWLDGVSRRLPFDGKFYANNKGAAKVTIDPIE